MQITAISSSGRRFRKGFLDQKQAEELKEAIHVPEDEDDPLDDLLQEEPESPKVSKDPEDWEDVPTEVPEGAGDPSGEDKEMAEDHVASGFDKVVETLTAPVEFRTWLAEQQIGQTRTSGGDLGNSTAENGVKWFKSGTRALPKGAELLRQNGLWQLSMQQLDYGDKRFRLPPCTRELRHPSAKWCGSRQGLQRSQGEEVGRH